MSDKVLVTKESKVREVMKECGDPMTSCKEVLEILYGNQMKEEERWLGKHKNHHRSKINGKRRDNDKLQVLCLWCYLGL